MIERQVRLASVKATRELGFRLGQLLEPGDFVGLEGPLGAGKTELVRSVCRGAEVPPERVSSPTFGIVATYQGRITLHHADLYRLADVDELYATGFFELIGRDAATLVEWIDRIPEGAPAEHLWLSLEHAGRYRRRLRARGTGARYERLLRDWLGPARASRARVRGA